MVECTERLVYIERMVVMLQYLPSKSGTTAHVR